MALCKKSVTNPYAANHLRRAISLAGSVSGTVGSRREFVDGCIVEGKRVGRLTAASVIEPQSRIYCTSSALRPNSASKESLISKSFEAGTREPFHPTVTRGVMIPEPDKLRKESYLPYSIGLQITDERQQGTDSFNEAITPVYTSTSSKHILRPDYMFLADNYDQKYLRVTGHRTSGDPASRFDGFILFIHMDEIHAISGEYRIDNLAYYARRSKVVSYAYGKLVLVAVVGKVIEVIPAVGYGDYSHPETVQHRETLVRLNIDLKFTENDTKRASMGGRYVHSRDSIPPVMTGAIFPESLIPEDLKPTTVLRSVRVDEDLVDMPFPAKTAMTIFDMDVGDNGEIIAAVKYQVKIQVSDYQERPYSDVGIGSEGYGVAAYGLASWGGSSSYFNIHEREVFSADDDNPLILAHGADPEYAKLDGSVSIIGGKFVRSAALVSRLSLAYAFYADNPNYEFIGPYFTEVVNGVLSSRVAGDPVIGIAYGGRALGYDYGFSIDFERDFYLHSEWVRNINNGSKTMAADTTYVVPASGDIEAVAPWYIRSTDQGIMFIDGANRKYEKVSEAPNTVLDQYITVSCHQREVRDGSGRLVTPSVIIVGAVIDGKHCMCVRKGPIWDGDFSNWGGGRSLADLWTIVPLKWDVSGYASFFYTGNPLMRGNYGSFFSNTQEVL